MSLIGYLASKILENIKNNDNNERKRTNGMLEHIADLQRAYTETI